MTDLIDNWMPTREAIAATNLSEARLRRLRNKDKNNVIKLRYKFMGRIILYYRPDIEALVRELETKRAKRQEKLARKKPG